MCVIRFLGWFLLAQALSSCAMVSLKSQDDVAYVTQKRADVLSNGQLSVAAQSVVSIVGVSRRDCHKDVPKCIEQVAQLGKPAGDEYLAALSELWLLDAKKYDKKPENMALYHDALLESARYAYAYLFYGNKRADQRALQARQTQVVDYYNHAVQNFVSDQFRLYNGEQLQQAAKQKMIPIRSWQLIPDMASLHLPENVLLPDKLIAATTLRFHGLRNVYQRDGFGAELVAILDSDAILQPERGFSEMNTAPVSAVIHFQGQTLDEVLQTKTLLFQTFDPFATQSIQINGATIPLAANFTAPYGVWLAQSGFATQSIKTLLGREGGIERPHVFLMQPYDPKRRIILMVHGLASSPEAWVNVANEILGDAKLREHYQIWQVYYPTNMPIALNHVAIRHILNQTLQYVDPRGQDAASKDMVVIGHSMGGVIARMMVSDDNKALDAWLAEAIGTKDVPDGIERVVRFEPMSEIGRVVFIAAPHQGTQVAGGKVGRLVSTVVRLPFRTLRTLEQNLSDAFSQNQNDLKRLQQQGIFVPNSIDNLDEKNRFVIANKGIQMANDIPYHSIIAKRKDQLALENSSDGVVPYLSAHLDGAVSEKIIISGHSVQENPKAILEIRRILHEDLTAHGVK